MKLRVGDTVTLLRDTWSPSKRAYLPAGTRGEVTRVTTTWVPQRVQVTVLPSGHFVTAQAPDLRRDP